jgi:hypothetical protein
MRLQTRSHAEATLYVFPDASGLHGLYRGVDLSPDGQDLSRDRYLIDVGMKVKAVVTVLLVSMIETAEQNSRRPLPVALGLGSSAEGRD